MNLRLTLADNWRQIHNRGTVILASACATVTAFGPTLVDTWNPMPQDLKAALPEGTARWVSTAAFVLLIALRPKDKMEGDDATQ